MPVICQMCNESPRATSGNYNIWAVLLGLACVLWLYIAYPDLSSPTELEALQAHDLQHHAGQVIRSGYFLKLMGYLFTKNNHDHVVLHIKFC